MLNFLISGANMIIQHKRQSENQQHQQQQQQQQQWGQQQGGWGGQQNDWGGTDVTYSNGLGVLNQNTQQAWGNNVDGYQWV